MKQNPHPDDVIDAATVSLLHTIPFLGQVSNAEVEGQDVVPEKNQGNDAG